jgi:hypothetical protein
MLDDNLVFLIFVPCLALFMPEIQVCIGDRESPLWVRCSGGSGWGLPLVVENGCLGILLSGKNWFFIVGKI